MTNVVNVAKDKAYVVPFEQLRMTDVEIVGGKNASLGEMISQLAEAGVRVPTGFATTALAFRDFLQHNNLTDRIAKRLETLDVDDVIGTSSSPSRRPRYSRVCGSATPERMTFAR